MAKIYCDVCGITECIEPFRRIRSREEKVISPAGIVDTKIIETPFYLCCAHADRTVLCKGCTPPPKPEPKEEPTKPETTTEIVPGVVVDSDVKKAPVPLTEEEKAKLVVRINELLAEGKTDEAEGLIGYLKDPPKK